MAAVLARNATDFRPFYRELSPSPLVADTAYSVSLLERYSPASSVISGSIRSPFYSSLDLNRSSQPYAAVPTEPRRSMTSMYSSPLPSSHEASLQARPPSHLLSPSGMIAVLDYTPSEGEANIPVTVNIELVTANRESMFGQSMSWQSMSSGNLKLRLVFGRSAVRTTVLRLPAEEVDRDLQERGAIRLRLQANAPPHPDVRFVDARVPLSVQAMDGETKVLETFTFGSFLYWAPTTLHPAAVMDVPNPNVSVLSSPTQTKRKREPDDPSTYTFPPESQAPLAFHPKKSLTTSPHVDKGLKLIRTTNVPAEVINNAEAQPAVLEWVVGNGTQHPNSLDKKWSSHELAMGRRLIRFHRELVGNKLRVSCEVIPQEAYDEEDIVISCVFRSETRNCWFTSVDIIYLLERLVGGPFSVEEKNRIRRNLEGFKPTTVSKTKGGFEAFFQRIMDFPPPKPRNIEKDVKVFSWSLLVLAIEKIISKYSVIPAGDSESATQSQGTSYSSPSDRPVRPAKAARSRSSTYSHGGSEEKSLKSPPSHQPLHMVSESPDVLHPDLSTPLQEPNTAQAPMDQYYFPDLPFPDEQQWQRRDLSLGGMSTQGNDFLGNPDHHDFHGTPGGMHTQPFSNPFASDINLGISLGAHGPGPSFDNAAEIHGSNPSSQVHGTPFDTNFADDVFDSRRSSLASDLLYPMSGSPPHADTDTMSAAHFGPSTQDAHNAPHDFLYPPFHDGSQNVLPLQDDHSQ